MGPLRQAQDKNWELGIGTLRQAQDKIGHRALGIGYRAGIGHWAGGTPALRGNGEWGMRREDSFKF